MASAAHDWLVRLAVTVPLLLAIVPARAAPGDACCEDLEERIAKLEEMAAYRGNAKVKLEISGYLNNGAMYWNDGFSNAVYFVTNETERSRAAFTAKAKITPKLSAGAILEIGLHGNRENRVDQLTPVSPALTQLPDTRYANWWLEEKDVGKLTVGRLKMATYHIVHMMLTETWYFARYGIGTWIGAENGGFFLRLANGKLTSGTNALRWGDIEANAPAAAPGEGARANGVKYETPKYLGFTASTAYSGEGGADVALRYEGEAHDFKLVAGIGYGHYWGFDLRRCAIITGDTVDCSTIGTSGTLMHLPTGLYAYWAGGIQQDYNMRQLFRQPVDYTDYAFYLQLGVEKKFFKPGKTTLFVEYEHDVNGAGVEPANGTMLNTTQLGPTGDPAYRRMAGSEINTYGLGIGQEIEAAATELYISGRLFNADVMTSANGLKEGAVSTSIEPFLIVMGGAKIAF